MWFSLCGVWLMGCVVTYMISLWWFCVVASDGLMVLLSSVSWMCVDGYVSRLCLIIVVCWLLGISRL